MNLIETIRRKLMQENNPINNIIKNMIESIEENTYEEIKRRDKNIEKIANENNGEIGMLAKGLISNINFLHAHHHELEDKIADFESKIEHLQKLFEMVCGQKLKED